MNLTPWLIGWAVLATIVLVLAIWRRVIADREDDSLHVMEHEESVVNEQVAVANKLAAVDRWGKILTVIAVVYGLGLAGVYVYQSWIEYSGPKFS